MIPQDLIQRACRTHDAAVKAAIKLAKSDQTKAGWAVFAIRYENSEQKFEAAMAALVESSS